MGRSERMKWDELQDVDHWIRLKLADISPLPLMCSAEAHRHARFQAVRFKCSVVREGELCRAHHIENSS
jgi:hypothetical protein